MQSRSYRHSKDRYHHRMKKRAPISSGPSEAELRKQQEGLSSISDELFRLSAYLNEKNDNLSRLEQELSKREKLIVERELNMMDEIEKKANDRFNVKEKDFREEVESIIARYDASLSALAKENKRLQLNLKEVVGVNRKMRDQLNGALSDLNDRNAKLDGLSSQLKVHRERAERYKNNINAAKSNRIVIESSSDPAKVHLDTLSSHLKLDLLKRLLPEKAERTVCVNASTQTMKASDARDGDMVDHLNLEALSDDHQVIGLCRILEHLLRVHRRCIDGGFSGAWEVSKDSGSGELLWMIQRRDDTLLKSIVAVYRFLGSSKLAATIPNNYADDEDFPCFDDENGVGDLFLLFVLDFSRAHQVGSRERVALAEAACRHREHMRRLPSPRPSPDPIGLHAKLVNRLVIVSGISKPEILEPTLEEILSDLLSCVAKFAFIDAGGIDFVHSLLIPGRHNEKVSFLASAIILNLCDDGEWLSDFLQQCIDTADLWSSVTQALNVQHVGTLENICVFLQKASKMPPFLSKLKNEHVLLDGVRSLMIRVLKERENNQHAWSDFLVLNLKSIFKNLDMQD
ncbi:hypothetical protein BC829DRAFT_384175 [Chytridium lagenaria]|nr:hypothetical protein BC829DRAFT_384175 [Chytridium lagenaria]